VAAADAEAVRLREAARRPATEADAAEEDAAPS